ncbi:MAG TPA: YggT family protein [Candidatus Paceibacterota bacterium]|nr:YggT family protein [Candidatus Paceibacterota bacterium]
MVVRVLDILIGLIEFMLALRIILHLLAANPGSTFVAWLYGVTDQLLAPFAGIFPSVAIAGNSVLEFSTIFAMFAYAFLGWLLIRIIVFVADTLLRFD